MIKVGGSVWQSSILGPLSAGAFISFGAPLIIGDNASPGALIAHASVTGQALSHTFTLTDDAGGQFAISTAGALSVAGPLTTGSNSITVQATNGVDAPIVQVFNVVATAVSLTTTTMETSVTDPLTGHKFNFVAADGVTPEPRECGQYFNGDWFVLGGPGNPVRIGSTVPASTSVSTAAYTRPDNLDDTAATNAQTRIMHGAMENPANGRLAPGDAPMAFDSYYGDNGGGPGAASQYLHSLNVDPGATGVPYVSEEATFVKSESLLTEGGHAVNAVDKTRTLKFTALTIVPEIPAANSFRPGARAPSKVSIATTDQVDIAGHRQIVTSRQPYTTTQINDAYERIRYFQETFYIHQEPSRRWNPGARGGGVDVYGDDWYTQFAPCFAAFDANYTEEEIRPIVLATIQVGLDIFGTIQDGDYIYPSQAHHASRKGIAFMAGLLLNNQDVLDVCNATNFPDNFGLDDGYTGYVTQEMVGVQPQFYKGAFPYKWEQEHVGRPEWSNAFPFGREGQVATLEQVVDSDMWRRSYQVLSIDNGAMYQALWAMTHDPNALYYKSAYFDFIDRYLAIRFASQIDDLFNSHGDAAGTNNVFTGNYWSINPSTATVIDYKAMRDAITTRPDYVKSMAPEPLPSPSVMHSGSDNFLLVDFNTNNVQLPREADAATVGFDLRWTAYAGGAEAVTDENDPAFIGKFVWHYVNSVTIPHQLTGVPRGLKVKIQIRRRNVNGAGPWMDCRKRQGYNQNAIFVGINHPDAVGPRYSTDFVVPDIAGFEQAPLNFGPPSVTPTSVVTGATLTASEGIWSENPTITATGFQWQRSDDGLTGWADISGATSGTYVAVSADEGKFVRVGISKTNSVGTSSIVYSAGSIPVSAPTVNVGPLLYGLEATTHNPGFGALGGKRLLIMWVARNSAVITNIGGTIGGYSFGPSEVVAERNAGTSGGARERAITYLVDVTPDETATDITMSHSVDSASIVVMELTTDMTFNASEFGNDSDTSASIATVTGGAAFFLGRGSSSITFNSSSDFTAHSDNATKAPNAAAAFALSTITGTATLDVSTGAPSNSIYQMISLAPAP